jgi:hypothetical protein
MIDFGDFKMHGAKIKILIGSSRWLCVYIQLGRTGISTVGALFNYGVTSEDRCRVEYVHLEICIKRIFSNFIVKRNKTGNVRVTEHWGAFVQPLLQWKNDKHYIL